MRNISKTSARALIFFLLLMGLLVLLSSISIGLLVSYVTLPSNGAVMYDFDMPNATYSISWTGAVTNVINSTSGNIVYSNANANLAFSAAFGYVKNGGSIAVQAGTYTANGASIMMLGCYNVNVTFHPNSILTITDNANVPVFEIRNSNNCIISGINIDGNAAKQSNWFSDGVLVYNSNNCLVTEADITNVRIFGYATTADSSPWGISNGITNSVLSYCGWNNIQLGMGESYTVGAYAINNDCSYAGDVGIACYGVNTYVADNYIHDITGLDATVNSHIGISVEWGGYNIIENNVIVRCSNINGGLYGTGVRVGTGTPLNYSTIVRGNRITDCQSGIVAEGSGFDVITENQITNWGVVPYKNYRVSFGISSFSSLNTIISFNMLSSSSTNTLLAPPIYLTNSINASVCNNTITTNLAAEATGVILEAYKLSWAPNGTLIQGNNIQAYVGITIDAGCLNVILNQNTLGNCTTTISDSGTGTIINPTSSATYKLYFNNLYNGTASGTYVYSNSTTTTITLTSGGVLNVDGTNVMLSANTYVLSMNRDHIVYAISSKFE